MYVRPRTIHTTNIARLQYTHNNIYVYIRCVCTLASTRVCSSTVGFPTSTCWMRTTQIIRNCRRKNIFALAQCSSFRRLRLSRRQNISLNPNTASRTYSGYAHDRTRVCILISISYYAYYYSRVLLVLVASIVFILEYSMHNMQNNYYSLVVLVL